MSEINIPERHDYNAITPFRLFVKSNFPFIENTYESLDNYGLYCKVVEYLNQVIGEQNKVNADMVTFTDFITNYFKNLDVTEEINNKLDEMVETGELQELINNRFNYLDNKIQAVASGSPAGVYPTLNDLQQADPNHSRIYVVSSTGNWYYYNTATNQWTSGGAYQSSVDSSDIEIINKKLDDITTDFYHNIYNKSVYSDYTNQTIKINFPKMVFVGESVRFRLKALTRGYIQAFFANGNNLSTIGFSSRILEQGEFIEIEGNAETILNNLTVYSASTINFEVWIYCTGWSIIGDIDYLDNNINTLYDLLYNFDKYHTYIQKIESSEYNENHSLFINMRRIQKDEQVKLMIRVKGEGYFSATFYNTTNPGNITVSKGYCKTNDILFVEGIASTDFDKLLIYATNNVPCDVYIFDNKWNFGEIIVDANGYGDFVDLDSAIKSARDNPNFPVTIRVRPGVYTTRTETPEDIPYSKSYRNLSIIGDDVNNCIIRNDDGYYSPYTSDSGGLLFDSSPIRLSGNVTIKNLTIISTDSNYNNFVESESRIEGISRAQSYCIHSDFDCDENTRMLIENCRLINDHYCCIGAGNRKNHTIQVENCEIKTTTDYDINNQNVLGSGIFIHSYNLNSGNAYEGQNIVVKNNIIENTNGKRSCYFFASNPDNMNCTLINNVSKTTDTQNGFESYGTAYGITKSELCFGNNINSMN